MKKMLMVVAAVVFLGGLGMAYHAANGYAKEAATAGISCPHCNAEATTGSKPVLSMLAGKSHACPGCGKEYSVAADQNAKTCGTCGGEVIACPDCGKAELLSKA